MATEKKNVTETAPVIDKDAKTIIGLMSGITEDEYKEVGKFTPIYKPTHAWADGHKDKQLAPIEGIIIGLEALPLIEGDEERKLPDFLPLQILVRLAKANRGYRGSRLKGEEPVEVPAGGAIYVPVNGNLLYNRPLMVACFDRDFATVARFRVTGKMAMALGDLWTWNVTFAKQIPRSQDRILQVHDLRLPAHVASDLSEKQVKALPSTAWMPPNASGAPQLVGHTANGTPFNTDTGEVRA